MKLDKNVGSMDKVVRYILAAVFALLIVTNVVQGAVAIVLGVLAVIFVVTSLINWCPIWAGLRVNTRKSE